MQSNVVVQVSRTRVLECRPTLYIVHVAQQQLKAWKVQHVSSVAEHVLRKIHDRTFCILTKIFWTTIF